jgi:hypothetical protein
MATRDGRRTPPARLYQFAAVLKRVTGICAKA